MKVLLDTCIYGKAKEYLLERGHEVIWSGDWDKDPGDSEILKFAADANRVLVTLDKDFGELAIIKRQSHCGILRVSNVKGRDQGEVIHQILIAYTNELERFCIITYDGKKVRIRENI